MGGILNPKQIAFVESYATCRNATEAAKAAGYSGRTAYSQGQRLLKHVEVRAALCAFQDVARADSMMAYEEALERLTAIARAEVGALLDEQGAVDVEQIKAHGPAIQSMDLRAVTDNDGTIMTLARVRMSDPIRAIAQLSKMRGWDAPAIKETQSVQSFADLVFTDSG